MPAIDAFRMSLNVPAVEVSLRVGREKVVEMTQRLGVVGVKKTCSMALGDTGITPLQHTGAFSTFANGGKLAKPYAILRYFNSKGDLIYSRDRTSRAPQIVSRVPGANTMMRRCHVHGKPPPRLTAVAGRPLSSHHRDAWFVGFPGARHGVWVDYDDFRPWPASGGALLAGQGLQRDRTELPPPPIRPRPDANQIAEQQRLRTSAPTRRWRANRAA
jgi:penicillin-binding protein 1A